MPTWMNDGNHNSEIARFVVRGDDFVNRLVSRAVAELGQTTGRYGGFAAAISAADPEVYRAAVKALYLRLRRHYRLNYENERDFHRLVGQQIRLPTMIEDENRGTCIDLALLFLSCLANAGLWPVYIQLRGKDGIHHALAATWLGKPSRSRMDLTLEEIQSALARQELLVVEATGFAENYSQDRPHMLEFDDARAMAEKWLRDLQLVFALDIEATWDSGVLPEETGPPPLRTPIPVPLPQLRGTFVDRDVECRTLRQLLWEGIRRVVVLVAPGGYGKTELMVKLLQEVAPQARIIDTAVSGILYLRCLRGDVTLGRIFEEAGRIVGRGDRFRQTYARNDWSLNRKLEFFLAELSETGTIWIVLDNFEDLLGPDDIIADPELRQFMELAADRQHTVRLIATTRAEPRFDGRRRVPSIDLSNGLPVEQAVAYLRTEGENYGLADVDEDQLRQLVDRVYCIPKALESVIGYLAERYPVIQVGDLLANQALFADFDSHDKETGLKSLIAQQVAQLSENSPEAIEVLEALAVCRKRVPRAVLDGMLPNRELDRILSRLIRNKLVIWQDDHYDLHPVVRGCLYAEISKRDMSRKAALHLRAAAVYHRLWKLKDQWRTLDDLEPQLEEFEQRYLGGDYDGACVVLCDIDIGLSVSRWGEDTFTGALSRLGYVGQVIDMGSRLVGKLKDPILTRRNCFNLGVAHRRAGNAAQAFPRLEEALRLARGTTADWAAEARVQGELGLAYLDCKKPLRARSLLQGALDLLQQHPAVLHPISTASWLGNLGRACHDLGDIRQAVDYYQQALAISQDCQDHLRVSSRLGNLARAHLFLGDVPSAIDNYQKALAIDQSPEGVDRRAEANHLGQLGRAYAVQGDLDRAVRLLRQALDLTQDARHRSYRLLALGDAYRDLNRFAEASALYKESLALDVSATNFVVAVKLGVLDLVEGRDSNQYFTRGSALCTALLEDTPALPDALYWQAIAEIAGGRPDAASETLARALGSCSAAGVVGGMLRELRFLEKSPTRLAGLDRLIARLEEVLANSLSVGNDR